MVWCLHFVGNNGHLQMGLCGKPSLLDFTVLANELCAFVKSESSVEALKFELKSWVN